MTQTRKAISVTPFVVISSDGFIMVITASIHEQLLTHEHMLFSANLLTVVSVNML